MSYVLRYAGRREAGGRERVFRRICPESSETLQRQKIRINPPGLTIIAYIPQEDRQPFRDAIDLIASTGRKFQACEQLHFTILGLFDERNVRPVLNRDEVDRLLGVIGEFLGSKDIVQIEVDFDFLRPGIFRGEPESSDGTVVAFASEAVDTMIIEYSKQLAAHLTSKFPEWFPEARTRPLGGVWCSLGFFDEADFAIDSEILRVFTKLEQFNACVHIDRMAIAEFTLKSLADAVILDLIRL